MNFQRRCYNLFRAEICDLKPKDLSWRYFYWILQDIMNPQFELVPTHVDYVIMSKIKNIMDA